MFVTAVMDDSTTTTSSPSSIPVTSPVPDSATPFYKPSLHHRVLQARGRVHVGVGAGFAGLSLRLYLQLQEAFEEEGQRCYGRSSH